MDVRAANARDIPALLETMQDFNRLERIPWTKAGAEPALRALLLEPGLGLVGVAHDAERPIGYFVLTWGFDLEWGGRDAFLTELYLVPDARGRGLGRELLAWLEREARRRGARALHLMVRPENFPALELYRKAGYESPPRLFLSKELANDAPPAEVSPPAPARAAHAGPFSLQRLDRDDSSAYNAFFRRGLLAHPDAFRISTADLDAAPFSTELTPDSVTLAAIGSDGEWRGVATVERERGRVKRRHIAWIVRMYVDAAYAGAGVGRALLCECLAEARAMPGVAKVNLTVAAHNAPAIRLYASEGFELFAREPDAFRNGAAREELTLTRVL